MEKITNSQSTKSEVPPKFESKKFEQVKETEEKTRVAQMMFKISGKGPLKRTLDRYRGDAVIATVKTLEDIKKDQESYFNFKEVVSELEIEEGFDSSKYNLSQKTKNLQERGVINQQSDGPCMGLSTIMAIDIVGGGNYHELLTQTKYSHEISNFEGVKKEGERNVDIVPDYVKENIPSVAITKIHMPEFINDPEFQDNIVSSGSVIVSDIGGHAICYVPYKDKDTGVLMYEYIDGKSNSGIVGVDMRKGRVSELDYISSGQMWIVTNKKRLMGEKSDKKDSKKRIMKINGLSKKGYAEEKRLKKAQQGAIKYTGLLRGVDDPNVAQSLEELYMSLKDTSYSLQERASVVRGFEECGLALALYTIQEVENNGGNVDYSAAAEAYKKIEQESNKMHYDVLLSQKYGKERYNKVKGAVEESKKLNPFKAVKAVFKKIF